MTPTPTAITLHQLHKQLECRFDNGEVFRIPCVQLRAASPSAENTDNIDPEVNIIGIDPVGQYAVKLIFDDGHSTGIYTWDVLYKIARAQIVKTAAEVVSSSRS